MSTSRMLTWHYLETMPHENCIHLATTITYHLSRIKPIFEHSQYKFIFLKIVIRWKSCEENLLGVTLFTFVIVNFLYRISRSNSLLNFLGSTSFSAISASFSFEVRGRQWLFLHWLATRWILFIVVMVAISESEHPGLLKTSCLSSNQYCISFKHFVDSGLSLDLHSCKLSLVIRSLPYFKTRSSLTYENES